MDERRKYLRVNSTFQIQCQTFDKDKIPLGSPETKNISVNGVLLVVPEKREIGQKIMMKFNLPGSEDELMARGKIVWAKSFTSDAIDIGVEFLNIRDADVKKIKEYILSQSN
ncbi:MAG: PilZ domain-containing protein [Spirochaetes bacterium]|nr:PilZ domain-containing protein [Spirochaetota bacterium]